ncbi:MAG: HAD-IIB family hydrolase [Spirochaetes bacterium]|nr:HAD-IIB family hydrolase [Spirochaetota bacterium]
MTPVSALPYGAAAAIRFVLFDIDDTITRDGRLLEASFSAMWRLREAGYRVVPVTGRPAGWCDCIARQWPVDGVVGENGAFAFFMDGERLSTLRHPAALDAAEARERLEGVRLRVLAEVPGARVAKDQFARLCDLAVDFAEEPPVLPMETALRVKSICESMGAHAKISSIHVNAWFGDYDKPSMAEFFLSSRFGYHRDEDLASVLYFGDSPNDEPMFARFPVSVGVANVRRYAGILKTLPAYVTEAEFGAGFAEGVSVLLNSIAQ